MHCTHTEPTSQNICNPSWLLRKRWHWDDLTASAVHWLNIFIKMCIGRIPENCQKISSLGVRNKLFFRKNLSRTTQVSVACPPRITPLSPSSWLPYLIYIYKLFIIYIDICPTCSPWTPWMCNRRVPPPGLCRFWKPYLIYLLGNPFFLATYMKKNDFQKKMFKD